MNNDRMNNQTPDNFDDQLDQILADVTVPADLKQSLLEIPEQVASLQSDDTTSDRFNDRPAKNQGLGTRHLLWATLAACLAGLAAFAWSSFDIESNPDIAEQTGIESINKSDSADEVLKTDTTPSIADLHAQADALAAKLTQRNLEQRLAELERQNNQLLLSNNDRESIILAITEIASLDIGVTFDSIKGDLQQVIVNYPDSRGSKIAEQFLSSVNNNRPAN